MREPQPGQPGPRRREARAPGGRRERPPLTTAGKEAPCLDSPGWWGFWGTLRVSSRQPRAPEGRGVSRGRDASLSPRPRSPFLVMHFLRPRIPFVLKFKKIRPQRAASWAGARPAGEGIPEWAARCYRGRGCGVSPPVALSAWPPDTPDLSPILLSGVGSAWQKPSTRGWCPPSGAPSQLRVAPWVPAPAERGRER